MPRIRIRTPQGERIVGSSNCSTLTVQLVSHAQRTSMELRAEAQLTAGERVLKRWTWDFPELDNAATVELISEAGLFFDPPDRLFEPSVSQQVEPGKQAAIDFASAEKEFKLMADSLAKINGALKPPSAQTIESSSLVNCECSFCGKGSNEVKRLIAGPSVAICDECIAAVNDLMRDQ